MAIIALVECCWAQVRAVPDQYTVDEGKQRGDIVEIRVRRDNSRKVGGVPPDQSVAVGKLSLLEKISGCVVTCTTGASITSNDSSGDITRSISLNLGSTHAIDRHTNDNARRRKGWWQIGDSTRGQTSTQR